MSEITHYHSGPIPSAIEDMLEKWVDDLVYNALLAYVRDGVFVVQDNPDELHFYLDEKREDDNGFCDGLSAKISLRELYLEGLYRLIHDQPKEFLRHAEHLEAIAAEIRSKVAAKP